jgi:hypothetical protein
MGRGVALERRALLQGAYGWLGRSAKPLLSADDELFLHDQARRIVVGARLQPGQLGGKRPNETPYPIHVPGGNMGYPAFWVRDAVMMLGGDLISPDELEGWIRLIGSTVQGPGEWPVRPGVVVPAYAIPDHINFDGKPTFYPGSYDTGAKQGGYPFGKYPPLDDYYYFLTAVWHHWKLTRSTSLFQSLVTTSWGRMRLCELCERVYAAPPADPATGLCVAGDIETENAKDFGFCDVVHKSGKLLFPSLLKFVAARQLAGLFHAVDLPEKARRFETDAARIRDAIPATFLHASTRTEAWLHSATGVGNQADVWGTAFAVWCGAVGGGRADRLSRALARGFRERTAVRDGCVRHILTTDPVNGGGWQSCRARLGEYQNGGYWGTPAGWYIATVARVDRGAAVAMAGDYIRFLRGHTRPDGAAEAWEWFNPDTGRRANPLYVATVALPWLSLCQSGLCGS